MQFTSPLSVTLDIIPPSTETNLENLENTKIFCCPQCLSDLGSFSICVMTFAVFVGLPLIEIVIVIVYVNECSMNYYIPIYLIVAGFISYIILVLGIFAWIFIWPSESDSNLKMIKSMFSELGIICKNMLSIVILFLLFGLAWFIAGNIWVFTGKSNVQYTDPFGSPNTYCNRTVYLGGFWSIIIKYIFGWLIVCRINCYLCSDVSELLIDDDQV